MNPDRYISRKTGRETSPPLLRSIWFAAGAAVGLTLIAASPEPKSHAVSVTHSLVTRAVYVWVLIMGTKDILLASTARSFWRRLEKYMATVFALGLATWVLGKRSGAWMEPLALLAEAETSLFTLYMFGAVALTAWLYKTTWTLVERRVFDVLPYRGLSPSIYRDACKSRSKRRQQNRPAIWQSLREVGLDVLDCYRGLWHKDFSAARLLPFLGPAYTLGLFLWLRFNSGYAELFVSEETRSLVAGEPLLSEWFLQFVTQALPGLIAISGVPVFIFLMLESEDMYWWRRWLASTFYCICAAFYGLLMHSL